MGNCSEPALPKSCFHRGMALKWYLALADCDPESGPVLQVIIGLAGLVRGASLLTSAFESSATGSVTG